MTVKSEALVLTRNRDNRNYVYNLESHSKRPEYDLIQEVIPFGSSVLDLGCGDGSLLQVLENKKGCKATGIEKSNTGVVAAKSKVQGNVSCGSIDEGLPDFKDDQFDYAICNVSIQMVMYPENVVKEMKRVSSNQIVSFPNFAVYKNRIELLLRGRMPRALLYGYNWYNTGHIHQLSLSDYLELATQHGLKVKKIHYLQKHWFKRFLIGLFPNLFGDVFIVETTKA